MKTILVAVFVIASVGFVNAQTPEWVTGKSSTYPDDQYITGVGSGDTRQEAENQARAHIAEVFRVQLNARFSTNKTETLNGSGSNVSGKTVDITSSSVNVGLTKTLEGTEIADVWQDPNDMEYYALAVLDRGKAAVRITDQISALDTELVEVGNEIDTAGTKLGKLRLLVSRKDLALKRQDLNSDYSVLSSSGQALPLPGISADEATTDLLRFCQNEIRFGLDSKGPRSESPAQVVSDNLTSQGLVIATGDTASPDFTLKVVTRLDPSKTPVDGWYYCRWDIELSIVDNATGVVMTDISKRDRSGQLSVRRAKDRAVYDMDKAVKQMTAELMNRLLGGQ